MMIFIMTSETLNRTLNVFIDKQIYNYFKSNLI